MAIMAKLINPSPTNTQKMMIDAALGQKDVYGNPFIIFSVKALVPMASYTSTHGIEDTIVSQGTNGLVIRHRTGRLRWMKANRYDTMLSAEMAKTPKNIMFLASHYYDGLWTIQDAAIDKECRELADKMRSEMSDEQIAAEKGRIHELHHKAKSGNRGGEEITYRGTARTQRERNLEERERRVNIKEHEVATKSAEVGTQAAEILDHIAQKGMGTLRTAVTEEALASMKITDLRKTARTVFGLNLKDATRPEIVKAIQDAQKAGLVLKNGGKPVEEPVPENV